MQIGKRKQSGDHTRWIAAAIIAAILSGCVSVAQTPSAGESAAFGSISGKVIDKQTGAALAHGWVVAHRRGQGAKSAGARIQPDGRFRIHRLEPGSYYIRVSAPGYIDVPLTPDAKGTVEPKWIHVERGKLTAGEVIKVLRTGGIRGRVVDENGAPLAEARVTVVSAATGDGVHDRHAERQGTTNTQGEFSVDGLPPGAYVLHVSYQHPLTGSRVENHTHPQDDLPLPVYPPHYYPGVLGANQAGAIIVQPGQELAGLDVTLRPLDGYAISGTATHPDGSPARMVFLTFEVKGEGSPLGVSNILQTRTGADGSFELRGLRSETYVISGSTGGMGTQGFVREEIVIGESDLSGVRLSVRPAVNVIGRLEFSGPKPSELTQAEGEKSASTMPIAFMLHPAPGEPGILSGRISSQSVKVDPNGEFRIPGLPLARYQLLASLPETHYLSRVEVGDRPVETDLVDFSDLSGDVTVKLHIKADTAVVTVQTVLETGTPVSQVGAILIPLGANAERLWWMRGGSADSAGVVRLQGVPPGEYAAIAVDGDRGLDVRRAEIRERLRKAGVRLTVSPNGNHRIQLSVKKPEEIN